MGWLYVPEPADWNLDFLSPSASRLWQTPNAENVKSRKQVGGAERQPLLEHQARQWQTPASDSFRSRSGDRVDEMGLDQQARRWKTPQAYSYAGSHLPGLTPLDIQARGMYDASPLAPTITTDGSTGSAASPILNPRFVETLMGWPIGWTDCGSAVTESSRYKLLMRSLLSQLRPDSN